MSKEYPIQVKKVVKKTKAGLLTLGIDSYMVLPKPEDSPLEMHSGFSRFKATILHRDENGNMSSVYANIPAEEIFTIDKITSVLASIYVNKKISPVVINNNVENKTSTDNTSPGYIIKIQNGLLRGKTPVQALLENKDNKAKLVQQKKWLSDNLDKYPNNKVQIDAIDDALKLFENNSISNDNTNNNITENQTSNCLDIYKVDIRIPNAGKLDKKGHTFMYSINIVCDLDKKNPICINICNMNAQPNTDANGLVTANLSNCSYKKNLSINLTFDEWIKLVYRLKNTVNNFETVNFAKQTKKASHMMAKQMLNDGLDINKVAEYTNLTIEEVKNLK